MGKKRGINPSSSSTKNFAYKRCTSSRDREDSDTSIEILSPASPPLKQMGIATSPPRDSGSASTGVNGTRDTTPASSSQMEGEKANGRDERQQREKRSEAAEEVETVEENLTPRTTEETSTKGQTTGRRSALDKWLSKAKEGKKAEDGKSPFSVAAFKSALKAVTKQRNDSETASAGGSAAVPVVTIVSLSDDDSPSGDLKKVRKKSPESVSRTRRDSTTSGRGRERKEAGRERSKESSEMVDVSSDESMASADDDESSKVREEGPPKTKSVPLLTIISSDEEGPEKRPNLGTKSRGRNEGSEVSLAVDSGHLPTVDDDENSKVRKEGPPKTIADALLTIISSDEEGPVKGPSLASKRPAGMESPHVSGDEKATLLTVDDEEDAGSRDLKGRKEREGSEIRRFAIKSSKGRRESTPFSDISWDGMDAPVNIDGDENSDVRQDGSLKTPPKAAAVLIMSSDEEYERDLKEGGGPGKRRSFAIKRRPRQESIHVSGEEMDTLVTVDDDEKSDVSEAGSPETSPLINMSSGENMSGPPKYFAVKSRKWRKEEGKEESKESSGLVEVSSDEAESVAANEDSHGNLKKGRNEGEGLEKRRHLATKSRVRMGGSEVSLAVGSGPLPTVDESGSESDINEPPGTRARNKKAGKANGPESERQRSPSFPPPVPFPVDGQLEPKPRVRHSFAFRMGESDGIHLHEPVPPFILPYLSSLYHPPAERLRFTVDVSGGKESRPIPVFSDDLEDRTPPTSFKYITTSILKTKELAPPLPRSLITCSCEGECVPESCQCASLAKKKGFQPLKNGKMEIKVEEEYSDVLLFACGPACGCPPNCAMRLQSTVSRHDLELFKRKENNVGFGVRTRSFIGKGELVMEFAGEVLDHREMGRRPKNHLQYAFSFYDSDEKGWKGGWVKHIDARIRKAEWPRDPLYIDPTRQGNIGRFVSNGCDGNLDMFRVIRNDLRIQNWRPFLVAKRDILPTEELFWDYGDMYKFADGITCRCNAVRCQHSAINRDLKYVSKEARMDVTVASTLHHTIVARNGLRDLTAIREPDVPPHKFNLSASLGIAEPVAATGRDGFGQADQFLYEKAADLAWKNKSCVKGPSGKPCTSHKDKSGFSLEQIEELRRNLQSFRLFRAAEPIPEVEAKAPVADEDMEEESEEDEEERSEKKKTGGCPLKQKK